MKTEYSGWPSSCDTEEAKCRYVAKYNELFGITLDRATLDKGVNEGLRYIAKQFLNSLWGYVNLKSSKKKFFFLEDGA